MPSRSSPVRPIIVCLLGLLVILVALPQSWKAWAPSFLRDPSIHYGLDLAGGTQLDFRISEAEIEKQLLDMDAQIAKLENQGNADQLNILRGERTIIESQRINLVEAIRTVLERRINSLGVSEATITPSFIGDEKHLLVECPGVVDVQKCIDTVGKTIQLEFKEEHTEASKEYEQQVRAKAAAALRRIRGSGTSLQVIGQDLGSELGILYADTASFFKDELPKGLESVWTEPPADGIRMIEGALTQSQQTDQGTVEQKDVPGIFLIQSLQPRAMTGRLIQEAPLAFETLARTEQGVQHTTDKDRALDTTLAARLIAQLRGMKAGELKAVDMEDGSARVLFLRLFTPGKEEVKVSHIQIAYKGASGAGPDVTRTKEQALQKAQDLKRQLDAGATFESLATRESDAESKKNGGSLEPFARGALVPSFEEVAFSQPVGKISDPVETGFGYHLIRVDKAPHIMPDRANFDTLTITGADALSRATAFIERMQTGKMTRQEEAVKTRFVFFSLLPTGWKDTALDGKHFRAASVTMDPSLNLPVVQIMFDSEGGKMFQDLTKRNIGKRIAIFVGGELVSAPTVQTEIAGGTAVITGSADFNEARKLAQDLNTGAIPAPIYLSGQRTVEATLGAQALQTSLQAALWGTIILMLFLIFVYRFLGILGSMSLMIYGLIFFALLKLPLFLFTNQFIVLTLAGTAGMILSIGMAVDTNVLVFERVKEELKKGKGLKAALETGFHRAWPSIRDSNIATIITCAILFLIGTSIVRGFAVTLGMGVVISMFTGMIITRWIAKRVANLPGIASKAWLFPGMRSDGEM